LGTRFSLLAGVQTSHTAHAKMYDVKIANIAGTKKKAYLLQNINQLQKHSKNNKIGDLYT
jgi:hypothetical protein